MVNLRDRLRAIALSSKAGGQDIKEQRKLSADVQKKVDELLAKTRARNEKNNKTWAEMQQDLDKNLKEVLMKKVALITIDIESIIGLVMFPNQDLLLDSDRARDVSLRLKEIEDSLHNRALFEIELPVSPFGVSERDKRLILEAQTIRGVCEHLAKLCLDIRSRLENRTWKSKLEILNEVGKQANAIFVTMKIFLAHIPEQHRIDLENYENGVKTMLDEAMKKAA